mgnify:CR=1 FL=1
MTAAGRSVHRAMPFSFKSEPFSVPVSAQMWVNLGRILVHKCRECLFFPFWYNPWLILRPKVVHYLPKKMGGLSAARRFSILIEIIYVFLTIFLYLPKCPQSLILSALRAFCFCGKPRISRSIFLYFPCQSWLKSW